MKKKQVRIRHKLRALDLVVALVTIGLIAFGLNYRARNATKLPCQQVGQNHTLELRDDAFNVDIMSVKQCDTITITNHDDRPYLLAFGTYNQHVDYPGYQQQQLRPGESIGIDAIQTGTYEFHDHYSHKKSLWLTIEPK